MPLTYVPGSLLAAGNDTRAVAKWGIGCQAGHLLRSVNALVLCARYGRSVFIRTPASSISSFRVSRCMVSQRRQP